MKTYRALVESLCSAIREEIIETGSIDEVPPSAQARYNAMLRALANDAIEETAFRIYSISFVRLVEYAFKAHRGCPVRLHGQLGEVYTQSVALLIQEGKYPVILPRRKRYADYLVSHSRPAAPEKAELCSEEPEESDPLDRSVYWRPSPVAWRSRAVEKIVNRYAGFDLAYFQGQGQQVKQ